MIPRQILNACDFLIQFNFTIAHIPGKLNTAVYFLRRSEINPSEKLALKIREDVPTQPIEVKIESTGITQEDQVLFHREDADLMSEEQLWQHKQQKQEKRNAVHTEPLSYLCHFAT